MQPPDEIKVSKFNTPFFLDIVGVLLWHAKSKLTHIKGCFDRSPQNGDADRWRRQRRGKERKRLCARLRGLRDFGTRQVQRLHLQPLHQTVIAVGEPRRLCPVACSQQLVYFYTHRPSRRYKPEDFTDFKSSGDVLVDVCTPDSPVHQMLSLMPKKVSVALALCQHAFLHKYQFTKLVAFASLNRRGGKCSNSPQLSVHQHEIWEAYQSWKKSGVHCAH